MPKSLLYNPAEYALVADRITEFYERFATGRIITHLVSRDRDVVFRAEVFRSSADSLPAATGWASEREGDGDVNAFACVENTETSAIGRALANLGFTASRKRPSYEEMQKVERARLLAEKPFGRPQQVAEGAGFSVGVTEARIAQPDEMVHKINDLTADVMLLLFDAKEAGVPYHALDEIRRKIDTGFSTIDELAGMERQLRHWVLNGYSDPGISSGDSPTTPGPVNTLHQ